MIELWTKDMGEPGRHHPALAGMLNIGWSGDLKEYGVTLSVWLEPRTLVPDFPGEPNIKYLYKRARADGVLEVAVGTNDETDAIHAEMGLPLPWPPKQARQISIFDMEG